MYSYLLTGPIKTTKKKKSIFSTFREVYGTIPTKIRYQKSTVAKFCSVLKEFIGYTSYFILADCCKRRVNVQCYLDYLMLKRWLLEGIQVLRMIIVVKVPKRIVALELLT